jgi:hypothetical protein
MKTWKLAAALACVVAPAAPALAAPCRTQGVADAPIAFPKNDASDVPFARSMVPVILPYTPAALPAALTCTRATVSTTIGDYVLGGENGEAFPRMALRADGKAGPVVYLAASPAAPGTFALVIHRPGSATILKRFYAAIPTDERLGDDVRAALADDAGLITYDQDRKMVLYGFVPPGGIPPPVEPVTGAGRRASVGPQIFVAGSGDPRLLDINAMRHIPSGFSCPQTFVGLAVLLKAVDPRADYLSCSYRAGTDLAYRPDDPVRYQLNLIKAPPGETAQSFFDRLTAVGRAAVHIRGDHAPPLAVGPAPAPEFVAYWDTEDSGVQGVWVGHAGGWIVCLRAQYPANPANDAEAGKVAQILFAQVAKQVR